jgi:transposase InsO family protein
MRGSRFSDEQIIGVLKEADAGAATAELCRRHGISPATLYNWKARFGGMGVSDARRLRDECLNGHWFMSLPEARTIVEAWRDDYNAVRPHSALDNRTPEEFAEQVARKTPVGL